MKRFKEFNQPDWGTDASTKKAVAMTPGQTNEISQDLKKRYAKKASSDIDLTKRDLKIAKDMDVPDVKKKLQHRLTTRRVGVARATEKPASKNLFDARRKCN